jgi:hypothetical protein
MVPPTNTNRLYNQQSKREIYEKRFYEAMRHIDIISLIEKKDGNGYGMHCVYHQHGILIKL